MNKTWELTSENGIGNLIFNSSDSNVNALSFENLMELEQQLDAVSSRSDLEALLVTSGKPNIFIAGADIKEIEGIVTADDAFKKAERGKALLTRLENLKIPTVCVINGACLGGGFELALSCYARVASFSPQVKIGLPEVNLGILPGFGGSIRLPRLLGLMKALPLILAGRIVGSQEALKLGMVDKLFPEKSLLPDAQAFALKLVQGKKPRKPRKNDFKTLFLEKTPIGRSLLFSQAKKAVLKNTKGAYPAPLEIIKLIKTTRGRANAENYQKESDHLSRLATTEVSKNLIKVFFLSERYKKRRWTEASITQDGVKKCGIVGAGIMGGGIAQLVSSKDIPVRVKDVNEKALSGALAEAMKVYRSGLKKRKFKLHEVTNKMALISAGLTHEGLKNCGVVIEAVVEDLGIKQKVFSELSGLTGQQTILASNTSSLSIAKMAEVCRYPERVVGLHFFNPVHRMPLVEVIRAGKTSPETVERTVLFARRLGKTVIVVADKPGFLVNRLLLPYMNEAAYLMQGGMAPERVDSIARGFGMPMGPIELVDQVGIDVGYKVAHTLEEAFGQRMKVASLLENVKHQGLLGKKSGQGFYIYSKDGRKKSPNDKIKTDPSRKQKCSDEEALKRMIYVMINEAARCLEEQVTDSPESVDLGLIMGAGFPPYRGGLLRYADTVGVASIVKDLERFKRLPNGQRFEPAAHLKKMAAENQKFHG